MTGTRAAAYDRPPDRTWREAVDRLCLSEAKPLRS
jgi:hypothetical protein